MSTRTVTFSINGNQVEIKSAATAALLESVIMTQDVLSDTLQSALDKKAVPAGSPDSAAPVALREFFLGQFTQGKNAEDVFSVNITHDDGRLYDGTATRQVIANRLTVATNIADYRTTVTKHVPQTAAGTSPKAKIAVAADDV
jgi:hypothetical protein